MSEVFFTSDWHLGHRSILKYRNNASTITEHDEKLFSGHKSVVSKRDTTYFIGDMLFQLTDEYADAIKKLSGRKLLILGNHDNVSAKDLLTVFDDIVGPVKYASSYWLSHHPIHPQELYCKINIHGHTHNQFIMTDFGASKRGMTKDKRYVNVCPDVNNFKPVSLMQIRNMK